MRLHILFAWICLAVICGSGLARAQDFTVTGQIELLSEGDTHRAQQDRANVVIWLTPHDDHEALRSVSQESNVPAPRLVQKNKTFEPHLLVVHAGTAVEFPNRDPFFHNVFSLFEGKRFDLGLYEAGTTRVVRFDRVGVSYIFCNIHPEMSAVVIALKTPYYGVSNAQGKIVIEHVPPGRYTMQVWADRASLDHLKKLSREVVVSDSDHSLGSIRIVEDGLPVQHKNKYGRDYDAPGSDYPSSDPK